MQPLAEIERLLNAYLPNPAVAYCTHLWKKIPFTLRVVHGRTTKAGDFSVRNGQCRITVNNDLNPYLFLITLVHEVAHAAVYRRFGNRTEPHGPEWKTSFRELMQPLLTPEVFPEDLLTPLKRHLQNPPSSTFADAGLTRCLRQFDAKPDGLVLLADLPERSLFQLQSRWFMKGPARRTRYACRDIQSKKIYLVPGQALVRVGQQGLFPAG